MAGEPRVCREGETDPKSHMESGMWGRIHYLSRSKQCPTLTKFTAVCSSWDIRLYMMWDRTPAIVVFSLHCAIQVGTWYHLQSLIFDVI